MGSYRVFFGVVTAPAVVRWWSAVARRWCVVVPAHVLPVPGVPGQLRVRRWSGGGPVAVRYRSLYRRPAAVSVPAVPLPMVPSPVVVSRYRWRCSDRKPHLPALCPSPLRSEAEAIMLRLCRFLLRRRRKLLRRRRRSEGIQNQCYHLSGGDNEILCRIPSGISNDSQMAGIGGNCNFFLNGMSRRATIARTYANSPKFPGFKRIFGRNKTFDMEERKTFISSGCNHLWQEKLYGITRVGVYGVESICVVTRSEDLEQLEADLSRLEDSSYNTDRIVQALINEVEDLACPPGEHHYGEKRNQKPFGVVSVIPGTDEGHKVNHHGADELKAIEFLREEMNITSTFTLHKAVKTAIRALQLLWDKKFKPNEIQVFIWKNVKKRDKYSKDDGVQVLKMRDERSVSDILSVFNNEPRSFADAAML